MAMQKGHLILMGGWKDCYGGGGELTAGGDSSPLPCLLTPPPSLPNPAPLAPPRREL